jgi:hypothetical protein
MRKRKQETPTPEPTRMQLWQRNMYDRRNNKPLIPVDRESVEYRKPPEEEPGQEERKRPARRRR